MTPLAFDSGTSIGRARRSLHCGPGIVLKSIHQSIYDDIETKIMDGTWQPGQRIPFEHELEREYGCSRMTVNKALTALADRGMILRKRRAGSFVAPPQIDRTVMEIQDIGADARTAGHDYTFRILSSKIERLGPSEALKLGEEAGKEPLRLTCLHIVDHKPHAIEHRVIMLTLCRARASKPSRPNRPAAGCLNRFHGRRPGTSSGQLPPTAARQKPSICRRESPA